ncbi:MAG TPA: sigma-70 family RNA polymerase sigma factor [Thermoanaerobaculia bacterium]|nr:sigma-70 family RNA polymerase sigma factor [Thermoanaerobaculia bacterium]
MPDDENQEPSCALPELIERLRPALGRLFRREGIPASDGEDLIQQAAAAALRRWPTIAHGEAWLYGTVRCMCIVYWRERRGCRLVPMEVSAANPRCASSEREQRQRRDRLLDLGLRCAKLPLSQRQVMFLRYRLGMSLAETAAATGTCVSTILRQERRALESLQRLFAGCPPLATTRSCG